MRIAASQLYADIYPKLC